MLEVLEVLAVLEVLEVLEVLACLQHQGAARRCQGPASEQASEQYAYALACRCCGKGWAGGQALVLQCSAAVLCCSALVL